METSGMESETEVYSALKATRTILQLTLNSFFSSPNKLTEHLRTLINNYTPFQLLTYLIL